MKRIDRILVYTYYGAPWVLRTGDSIRIHTICKTLSQVTDKLIVYNLSHLSKKYKIVYKDGVLYVCIPRKFYHLISKLVGWRNTEDLNVLIKLTPVSYTHLTLPTKA